VRLFAFARFPSPDFFARFPARRFPRVVAIANRGLSVVRISRDMIAQIATT